MTQLLYRVGFLRAKKSPRQLFTVANLFFLCLTLVHSATATGQVSESSNRFLRDVAKVTLDRSGQSVISFNPARCRALGPELCEFFRAHEYGHVNLQHLERGTPTRQAEQEADLWAARNASPQAVQAARDYFLSGKGGSRVHGTPQERASRMSQGAPAQYTQTTTAPRTSVATTSATTTTSSNTGKRLIRYSTYRPTYAAGATRRIAVPPTAGATRRVIVSPTTSAVLPRRLSTSPTASAGTTHRVSVAPAATVPSPNRVYVTNPATTVTVRRVTQAPQPSRTVTTNKAPTRIRYTTTAQPAQTRVSPSRGYVPRGDFINPR